MNKKEKADGTNQYKSPMRLYGIDAPFPQTSPFDEVTMNWTISETPQPSKPLAISFETLYRRSQAVEMQI